MQTVRQNAVTQQQCGPTNLQLPSMAFRVPFGPLTYRPGPKRYGGCRQARLTYSCSTFHRASLSSGPSGRMQRRYPGRALGLDGLEYMSGGRLRQTRSIFS
ncbi:hypothetical protein CLIM01_05924 [Colletotrichum limetticola]|uniref:Uncharacterized protein n=1 Tax=Colletotrichum limetticola TaxID=1209924 RepID=A0ABQ9PYX7_9PEZI|nr:hypothetical protein CLIM01_05924 [Colletotrichum limetticola]